MKISVAWIRQFTDVELDTDELVRRVGSQLGAIEEVIDWGSYFSDEIVVAKIVKAEDHPDADKLGVYEIDFGSGTTTVCAGDKSLKEGDLVGYIPPGSDVPASVREGEPFTIEARELRGVTSNGMLGSAKELLFSEDHEGVQVLDTDAAVGTSLVEAYDLKDVIIDVENKMFTHRPDLFGILGLAREVAGIQGIEFTSPDWYAEAVQLGDKTEDLPLDVDIQVPELCPRFSAVTFANVEIKPSPLQMQSFLTRVGLRPISNVVDITNFGMYLTAQPTHAFDYDKVAEVSDGGTPKIVVRKPREGEKLTLLDGREIEPHADAAMVATESTLLSVGGSMGGADSEVSAETKNVILEAASWNLYSIRRTSFAHGIFTDAVTRFNKGQSPRQTVMAIGMMTKLFVDNTNASIASDLIDEYPEKDDETTVSVDVDFINTRLGSEMNADQIAQILNNVELQTTAHGDSLEVIIPFWRTDLELAEDIVEEVGRLHGYDNLPVEVPTRKSTPNLRTSELQLKGRIRTILSGAGARDVLTYNFVSGDLFTKAGYSQKMIDAAYRIRNSLSPELEYMRIALLPSLTDKVTANIRSGHGSFALYEINKSHNKTQVEDDLPVEHSSVAMVVASDREQNGSAYYQAKAYIDYLVGTLGQTATYRAATDGDASTPLGASVKNMFASKRLAAVEVDGKFAGFVGEFSASAKQSFKLPRYSAGFELDLATLHDQGASYEAISRYPSTTQDVTLATPEQVEYGDVLHLVEKSLASDAYSISIEPVGIYREADTGPRNITFRITFVSHERTLETKEINEAIAAMVAKTSDVGIAQV